MGDIKVFQIRGCKATELEVHTVDVEKSLQSFIEENSEPLFSIRFLHSEYSTSKAYGGRVDTLGIDENWCPVIIEYKRSLNQNVINQGLFYLDWLLDHRAEFALLVQHRLGRRGGRRIEWSSPRLLCIAGDFTVYDQHAVQQINRNIELIRYRQYGKDLILFELVNTASILGPDQNELHRWQKVTNENKTPRWIPRTCGDLCNRFEALKNFLLALGDDVEMKRVRGYVAFKRFKNFACLDAQPRTGKLLAYLRLSPTSIKLHKGFSRDVRNIVHLGTGDLELTISSMQDIQRAEPLLVKSYELN